MAERTKYRLIPIILILSSLEGLALLIFALLNKSAEGGIILGLSAARLGLAAAVFGGTALLFGLALMWHSQRRFVSWIKEPVDTHTSSAIFILFWAFLVVIILQIPAWFEIATTPFRQHLSPQLYTQLRPLLIWIAVVLIQLAIGITFRHRTKLEDTFPEDRNFLVWLLLGAGKLFPVRLSQKRWRTFWHNHKASLLVFMGILVVWAGIVITRAGINPDTKFWNIAGIPILWHQVIFTILLTLFLLDIQKTGFSASLKSLSQRSIFPVIVVLILWAAAILIWQGEPLRHTYFSPGPYPPNYVKYPFSDARWFDTGGQYFLMGEGLYNNHLTDRPYLMLYHAFLHVMGGQDYARIALFQVILLALIPAGLFLIGWKLISKLGGFSMAILYIFREKNAIEGAYKVGLVNAKTLTSEMPNALLLVLITICLIYWFRQKKPAALWPILAGGLTGMAIGVRGNSLTILPLVLLLALLVYLKERIFTRQWLLAGVFFLLGASVVLTPYSINNIQNHGSPFWLEKIQNVIIRSGEEPASNHSSSTRQKLVPENALNLQNDQGRDYIELTAAHFFHNEITTVLMLPINWQAEPLKTAIEHPIWDNPTWQGNLAPGEILALGANLLILAFGIGDAWRRWRIIGLTPLAVHLTYNLTNSLAHTSGGRYLVSTDWVLLLYFALGVLAVIFALRNWQTEISPLPSPIPPTSHRVILPALSLVGFLLFGASFMISGLIPQSYELGNQAAYWKHLENEQNKLVELGIDLDQIETFLQAEDTVLNLGLALYPHFYEAGEETETSSHLPRIPAEDARLYFLMLEANKPRHVSISLIPDEPAAAFPHGAYGLILGCEQEDYTQGKLFIPLDSSGIPILTEGVLKLSCD